MSAQGSFLISVLEQVTFSHSRMRREAFGSLARAIFSQDAPVVVAYQRLEPHGLPSPKVHLCGHSYTI